MNWQQLKTILWLHWQLSRNQLRRGKSLGAALATLVTLVAIMVGGLSFVGALLTGALALGDVPPPGVMGVWLAVTFCFLLFWSIGVLVELQRSEMIDLRRLLHLPVALEQMFAINYLASHTSPVIILLAPAMLGLALGMALSRGPLLLLLVPLSLSTLFMITAWTYNLRGWLAGLMTNPRRRRTIIMLVTAAFILIAQIPNFYVHVWNRVDRQTDDSATPEEVQKQREERRAQQKRNLAQLVSMQRFIPPFWLPVGARGLAEGRVGPALLGTLGGFVIGAMGLSQAYRNTLRFYRGQASTTHRKLLEPTASQLNPTKGKSIPIGSRFLERRLPGVPDQAAALALATFRSLQRAPEVKMALGGPLIIMAGVGMMLVLRGKTNLPEMAKPFLATGSVVLPLFMVQQFLANQFGLDRDGFRTLILVPVERRLTLLAKNLACAPVGGVFGLVFLAIAAFWLKVSATAIAAAVVQLGTALLLASLLGNLLSIIVPYRIEPGTMKPTKMPMAVMLMLAGCHLLFPLIMLPLFLPVLAELLWVVAGFPKGVPLNLLLSIALLVITALIYWQALGPLGRLLERRETKILGRVTVQTE